MECCGSVHWLWGEQVEPSGGEEECLLLVLHVGRSDKLLRCLDRVDLSELMESNPEEELPLPVALVTEPPVWFDLV